MRTCLLAIGAAFAAILPWLVVAEHAGHFQTPRPLIFLGNASYSIHLVHALPLLLLVGALSGMGWLAVFLIIGAAGLMSGLVFHLLAEQPLLASPLIPGHNTN